MPQYRKLLAWLPALLWAGVIFWLSSMPFPPSPGPRFPGKDKVGHWAIYGLLGYLVTRGLRAHNLSLPKTLALAMILTSAYGASDEWHQSFVPYRQASVEDLTADFMGVFLGTLVLLWMAGVFKRKERIRA